MAALAAGRGVGFDKGHGMLGSVSVEETAPPLRRSRSEAGRRFFQI